MLQRADDAFGKNIGEILHKFTICPWNVRLNSCTQMVDRIECERTSEQAESLEMDEAVKFKLKCFGCNSIALWINVERFTASDVDGF